MTLAPRASTGRSGRLAAILAALSLTAGLQLGLADDASATVTAGPVFNGPTGTVAEQRAIRTLLLDCIGQSASGSSIWASVYHFWDESLAQALANARAQDPFVGLCPVNRSCLGQPPPRAPPSTTTSSDCSTQSSCSRFWNDAYVLLGHTAIFTAYSDYFAEPAGKTERTGNPAGRSGMPGITSSDGREVRPAEAT